MCQHHRHHPHQPAAPRAQARRALAVVLETEAEVELLAAGRTSQAWKTVDTTPELVVRVPIPNSGRVMSYRSEALIGRLLAAVDHPVSTWTLAQVDGVTCLIGQLCAGTPVDYGWQWPPIWPFDGSSIDHHLLASLAPDLVPHLRRLQTPIAEAAGEPVAMVHSDLHRQHLLHVDDQLTGLLDFGDSFVGSTAWDFALLRWYYGPSNPHQLITAYHASTDAPSSHTVAEVTHWADLLAVAVGCYKVAKSPGDHAIVERLRDLVDTRARRLG